MQTRTQTYPSEMKETKTSGSQAEPEQKKRICCVCKETKGARDTCILMNGEEKCQSFIATHNACLRAEGFKVEGP